MSVIILLRSVTYAQRAQRALLRRGIGSEIVRAPQGSSPRGCAHALRLPERRLREALGILREEGIEYGRVLMKGANGSYEEVLL